jgi:hypothetical protein
MVTVLLLRDFVSNVTNLDHIKIAMPNEERKNNVIKLSIYMILLVYNLSK